MWDEFNALVPRLSCYYDRSGAYVDHLQYLQLFAFLIGLSEICGHARSQILMMIPLPSVSKPYTMIVADERQRVTSGIHTSGDIVKSIALYVGKGDTRNQCAYI